ncbi:MAG: tetratricopeptide repeat protein [Myxococcota bacterium]
MAPTPTGGDERGAPPERTAVELLDHGIGLLNAGKCASAIREGFDPAITRFGASVAEGTVVRAVRSDSPAATLMRLIGTDELGLRGTGAGGPGRSVVVLGPDYPDAHFFRAFCLVELGQFADAEAALRVALAMMPRDVVYSSELGHIRHQHRDWAGALAHFDDALRGVLDLRSSNGPVTGASMMGMSLGDWHRRALRGRGFSLVELGRLDEAEAAYRQVLDIDASDAQARRELDLIAELRRQGRSRP